MPLVLEEIIRVRFVREEHPDIQRLRARLAGQQAKTTRQHRAARARERTALEAALGRPFAAFSTADTLWQTIQELGWVDPTARCPACRWSGPDRYRLGGYVCWVQWAGHGPPRRLQTLDPCADFLWTIPLSRQCVQALEHRGFHYSPGQWTWHRVDLGLTPERLGFQAGIAWEQRVRAWLATRKPSVTFLPHRWLIATDRRGHTTYRQVDGVERWDEGTAFVYEIKRHESGYEQLTATYVPLLRMAFPWMRFVPLEIGASRQPDGGPVAPWYAQWWKTWREERDITELSSLDQRHPDYGYQFYLPRAEEVAYDAAQDAGGP